MNSICQKFYDDHNHAYQLAENLQVVSESNAAKQANVLLCTYYEDLASHFFEEEASMQKMPCKVADRIVAEHREMERMISDIEGTRPSDVKKLKEQLINFGGKLKNHIKLEESQWLQQYGKNPYRGDQYPDAGKNAPAGVKQAVMDFKRQPKVVQENEVLLYYVLGGSTPAYKMSKAAARYKEFKGKGDKMLDAVVMRITKTFQGIVRKVNVQRCGNCKFAYMQPLRGKFICSQMRGEIKPSGYCKLFSNKITK